MHALTSPDTAHSEASFRAGWWTDRTVTICDSQGTVRPVVFIAQLPVLLTVFSCSNTDSGYDASPESELIYTGATTHINGPDAAAKQFVFPEGLYRLRINAYILAH